MTDASEMFYNASLFNAAIGSWDVRKTETFVKTFAETPFNQPLKDWQLQSAKNLTSMFEKSSFNQDLSSWDIPRVLMMSYLFANATSFRQNLCVWGNKVTYVLPTIDMFQGTACPITSSPKLLTEPSGPWCEFCGSRAPTPNPLTGTGETGNFLPTTASPTETFRPTDDQIDLRSNASRIWNFLSSGLVCIVSFFLAL